MIRRSTLVLFILGVAAAPARASEGMPRNGFWLEARFAAGTVLVGTNNALPLYQPSLTVGGRLAGRVNLGLGFSFFRLASGNNATSTFVRLPTVQVDIVKAHDDRVAMYGKAGLPLGAQIITNNRDLLVVGYDLALGVRYAPHPMFAFGVEGGVLGVFSDPGPNSVGAGVQSIYGAFTGSFFYGR
jgi:hypothetical protein